LVYELNGDLKPIRHYYFGDAEHTQKAIQAVAGQAVAGQASVKQ
jgi:2,3-bisphosphoglycerate-dependent phosphoglycerate mutase